jgi:hypothetical protein
MNEVMTVKDIKYIVNKICQTPLGADKNITITVITTTGRRAFIYCSARAPPRKSISIFLDFQKEIYRQL